MTPPHERRGLVAATATALLLGCGGGTLDNPGNVVNPAVTSGRKLSFTYFQRCVAPVLNTPQTVLVNGVATTNTCAAGGCHDNTTGTGGALRLFGSAAPVDLAQDAAAIRATDMYKNYYSALGESVVGAPDQSRLLNKPLVRDVLHGGGVIFEADADAARIIRTWINRPMPSGQDEFSSAADTMFTPADPATGACNVD
jgi:hypothetical protein